MHPFVLFVLMVFAAYRVWRFLALDDLPPIEWARQRFYGFVLVRFGSEWAGGIECPWCSGWWVSVAVVSVTWGFHPLPLPGLWYLAVAAAVALLATAAED